MSDKNKSPNAYRFVFYHQNEALLFQFLMHEGLRAHSLLRKKPCSTQLVQIIGNSSTNTLKNWQAPLGHLPRLMHYYHLLSTHFNQTSALHTKQLEAVLNRAVDAVKKYWDQAKEGTEKECAKLYPVLKKEIGTFIKILLEKLPDYRDNPSVLYFLLRHQKQVDAVLRQAFVQKTFKAFFPEGLEQASLFIIEKFTKKGFIHLIPTIKQQIQHLEYHES